MTQPENRDLDLAYRPESYWDVPERIHANIKGEHRRRQIDAAIREGTLADLPANVFSDDVPSMVWRAEGRIDPFRMGGETLPDYDEDEVEIARVSFPLSVLGDVYSVRARRRRGRIHYRIVDDNAGGPIAIKPKTSTKPLSFGQLITLIETANNGEDYGHLFRAKWWWDYEREGETPERCTEQIELSSVYYPELATYYDREAAEWCRECHADMAADAAAEAQAEALENDRSEDLQAIAPALRRLARAAAECVRSCGYTRPLFTPEAAQGYLEHKYLTLAAAAFTGARNKPPAEVAHLGPLDPGSFDPDYAPRAYVRDPAEGTLEHVGECARLQDQLFADLPALVHALVEASAPDEDLPPLEPTEVEIARMSLDQGRGGLLSLRAASGSQGIRYRLVSALDTRIRPPFESSEGPLTLRGVIERLDGAWDAGPEGTDTPETSECGIGAVLSNWEDQLERGATPQAACESVVVSSVFYPMLARWYEAAARAWQKGLRERAKGA